jgi:hypothetical protein
MRDLPTAASIAHLKGSERHTGCHPSIVGFGSILLKKSKVLPMQNSRKSILASDFSKERAFQRRSLRDFVQVDVVRRV